MNKIAVATLAVAMFMVTHSAWATVFGVTEKIRSIDIAGHDVVLADGWHYIIPADLALDTFKVGDVVTVTAHDYHDGLNYVETMTKEN